MERDADLAILRIAWRLDDLDKWRKGVDAQLGVLDARVREIVKADEIAEAVATKLDATHSLHLTIVQKVGAGAFAVALVLIPIAVEKLT